MSPNNTISGDAFDPTTTSVVLDSNGNGVYDPGVDVVYSAGSNDPMLAPDASIKVFLLSTIPASATDGQRGATDLSATAVTGSGTPGTSFAGQGTGGSDAVVGATTASGSDRGYYIVSAATVAFVKSATVLDPFGGSKSVPRRDDHVHVSGDRQWQWVADQFGGGRHRADQHDLCARLDHASGRGAYRRDRCRRRSILVQSDRGGLRHRRRGPDANRHLQSKNQLKRISPMKILLCLLSFLSPAIASAANDVALTSTVFVEKAVAQPGGKSRVVLEEPRVVVPGDHLVFVLAYRNQGAKPATDFVVTNPLPGAVAYQGTTDAAAIVSVDGGKSWGPLGALKFHKPDGSVRAAYPEDVTHVRWAMRAPIPVGATGKLSFRGVVR